MIKIVCPVCGAEYLPSEVYYPKDFLGQPSYISKTREGRIEFFSGSNMNLKETYVCDFCKHTMTVKAFVNFSVDTPQLPPSHITKFKTSTLTLDED